MIVIKKSVNACEKPKRVSTSSIYALSKVKKAVNDNVPDPEITKCIKRHLRQSNAKKIRKHDKRLWAGMTDDQFRSAQQIYYGFQMLVSGIGYRTQTFDSLPKGNIRLSEGKSDLVESFRAWSKEAVIQNIFIGDVLDILAFGYSYREIDKMRRKRKGYAKRNLLFGLDLYKA